MNLPPLFPGEKIVAVKLAGTPGIDVVLFLREKRVPDSRKDLGYNRALIIGGETNPEM